MSRRTPRAHARERAIAAVTEMRARRLSLAQAARATQTTPRTVLRYARSALRRTPSGQYRARAADRLTRYIQFLTPTGPAEVAVRGSRAASRIAQHMAAV